MPLDMTSIEPASPGDRPNHAPVREGFRVDVNGLRAWAVIVVILYHFRVPGFGGGFVGVDVFFVISGFLMTGLVYRGLSATSDGARFSVLGFYLARARRIVPALAGLCAALLVLGWNFLSAMDFRQLGSHAASALTFVSNIKFWREAGYFDAASHDKWLLHTWSLSVEWQFYLALPLAMILVWKLSTTRRTMTCCIAVALVASLALSVLQSPALPTASFYLLPTRAWEMLAGGLVFLLPLPGHTSARQRTMIEFAGFALVLSAVAIVDATRPWPGSLAILPVAGSALIILAARRDSAWTNNGPAQWLGNTSYSAYLWHWPVVVFLAFTDRLADPGWVALGIAASLVAGHASWALVENPSRAALAPLGKRQGMLTVAAMVLLVAVPAGAVFALNGVPGRLAPGIEAIFDQARNVNPRRQECHVAQTRTVPECRYGDGPLAAIVIGDSHAASLVRTVERAAGGQVLDWTYSSCPTMAAALRAETGRQTKCRDFVRHALAKGASLEAAPLFIINRSSGYAFGVNDPGREFEHGRPQVYFDEPVETASPAFLAAFRRDLVATACDFARQRPTFLVRPIPELRINVPRAMGRAKILGGERRVSITLREYTARHRFVMAAQDEASARCGVRILDPVPILCPDGTCWGDVAGMPSYYDDNHLSERGAALLLPLFKAAMADAREAGTQVRGKDAR